MNKVSELLELLTPILPEGEFNVNGKTIKISKPDDSNLTIEVTEDDQKIKDEIKDYMKLVNALDECSFCEAMDTISNQICLNEFNNLLMQKWFDDEDIQKASAWMEFAKKVIKDVVLNKKQKLEEVIKRLN